MSDTQDVHDVATNIASDEDRRIARQLYARIKEETAMVDIELDKETTAHIISICTEVINSRRVATLRAAAASIQKQARGH